MTTLHDMDHGVGDEGGAADAADAADVADVAGDPVAGLRTALTGVLVAVVVIGAVVPWLAIVTAWRLSGDPTMSPYQVGEASRSLVVAEVLSFTMIGGSAPVVLAIAAAVALVVLWDRPAGAPGAVRTHRWVLPVVAAAGAVASLAALVHAGILLLVMTIPPEELNAAGFGERLELVDLQRAVGLIGQALAWSAVLLFALGRWRGMGGGIGGLGSLAELSGTTEDPEDPEDPEGRPVGAPRPGARSGPALPDGLEPARLRPDGSSDSGFDEFHFRR